MPKLSFFWFRKSLEVCTIKQYLEVEVAGSFMDIPQGKILQAGHCANVQIFQSQSELFRPTKSHCKLTKSTI